VTPTRNGTALTTNVAQAREALGAHLRQLRRDADLTGRELAAACGWLPSKVSKIENGKQTPSPTDVRTWASATGHPEAEAPLRAELAALESFYRDWRRQLKAGMRFRQVEALGIEADTRHLRVWEPNYVPGLLQTAEYARIRLAQGARLHGAPDDVGAAVAIRMNRQHVLHLPTKRFDFLIAEGVLRDGNAAPPDVMAGQLDRLMVATTHTTVRLGVIPAGSMWPFHADNGFWLYDADAVIIETLTAELRLVHADEVAVYARVHAALADVAVYGTGARALIAAALSAL
jgi:transcriptional regulator with XRE-family HTH domain